jgi:DNA replication protein DnaC
LGDVVTINKKESYNLIGSRPLCVVLKNKITHVKEKGYLEDKQRVGQIGFTYLQERETIKSIIEEAINLNPDESSSLHLLSDWLQLEEAAEPNYWVFQANPTKVYRILDALQDGLLRSWMVNQQKREIKIGDKVILWVSGDDAGIYALATVTSPVHSAIVADEELEYFIDQDKVEENDRVNLRMDYNLVNSPILKAQALAHPILKDIKQGTQGTNFQATIQQYQAILSLIQTNPTMENSLNKILYGPPGTGKTYNTISEAVKIVDPDFYSKNNSNRDALQAKFNELLINDWKSANGQIAFCTFHQSFSYEDFVEGIKPKTTDNKQVYYEVEDGIFKSICRHADAIVNAQTLAKDNLVALTQDEFNQAVFYKLSLGDTTKDYGQTVFDYCIKNNVISIGFGEDIDLTNKTESEITQMVPNTLDDHAAKSLNYFRHYLKVGNYVVIANGNNYIRAIGKVTGEYKYEEENEIGWNHIRSVEWIFSNVDIPVNEFYQNNLTQKTIYKLKKEFIISSFFVRASKTAVVDNKSKHFVLIIDEINRGNVSSIFGELITLIEPTKRAGKPEALEVVLPYSKLRFTVPANVHIIGTMNTADRSIESLDTALRRRFSFQEMAPNADLIKTEGKSKGKLGDIDLIQLLNKMNDRIEKLIDKDHKIGHSYFITVLSVPELQLAFKDKVIPLLEEYFFGDFGKIGLVLGNSFIEKVEHTAFDFAKFSGYDEQVTQDLTERSVYKIKSPDEWDFKAVYTSTKIKV